MTDALASASNAEPRRESRARRLETVQSLRFLASLLVLVTHSGFYVHERLDNSYEYWRQGAAGVMLFFVISGFVIILSSEKLIGSTNAGRVFAVKRLVRIVPIYWIATTVKVIALIVASHYVFHSEFDLWHVLKSYLFIPEYNASNGKIQPLLGVGWSLVFEVFFYAIFGACLAFRIPPFFIASVVLVSLAAASPFKDTFLSKERDSVLYFLLDPIVLTFLFGMILGKLYQRQIFLPPTVSITAIALGLSSIFFDIFSTIVHFPPLITIGLASFFVLWGSVSLESSYAFKVPKLFVFLGEASYSTYLFHPLFVPIIPTILAKIEFPSPGLATTMGVVGGIAVGSAIYVVIEKPCTRFLTRIVPQSKLGA